MDIKKTFIWKKTISEKINEEMIVEILFLTFFLMVNGIEFCVMDGSIEEFLLKKNFVIDI